MIVIGALLAGLFLILKDLVPLTAALGTGAIQTRGHRRQKVERATDPQRFRNLCRNRYRGIGLGLVVVAAGIGWALKPWLLSLMAAPLVVLGGAG